MGVVPVAIADANSSRASLCCSGPGVLHACAAMRGRTPHGVWSRRPLSLPEGAAPHPQGLSYSAIMRAGQTKTTSFSLDAVTLKNLKALAARRHKGNVSALLAEVAAREAKFAAAEAFFEKYGVPPLTEEAIERIEAEWRGETRAKKKRRHAA